MSVAAVLKIPVERLTANRMVVPRMIVAWLGRYEGKLDNRSIADALRIGSASAVTKLVSMCERSLDEQAIRDYVERCRSTLRGMKDLVKT